MISQESFMVLSSMSHHGLKFIVYNITTKTSSNFIIIIIHPQGTHKLLLLFTSPTTNKIPVIPKFNTDSNQSNIQRSFFHNDPY